MATTTGKPLGSLSSDLGDAQGQLLLAALTSFLQPIMTACTLSSKAEIDHASKGIDDRGLGQSNAQAPTVVAVTDSTKDASCPAGTNLLLALQEFIKVTLNQAILGASTNKQSVPNEHSMAVKSTIMPRAPVFDLRPHTNISPEAMEKLRRIVFNDMPIRLLSFDSNGSRVELIEREEILRRCVLDLQAAGGVKLKSLRTIGDNAVTKYAILSHTWFRDKPGDVVYKDWDARELNNRGHDKIKNFCRVSAREHGVKFAWIDTICINKDSSTELDESIRSMYKWYRNSEICVTYLAGTSQIQDMADDPWFTRGWTLQELLAPEQVAFYDKDWRSLGFISSEDNGIRLSGRSVGPIVYQIETATTITHKELVQFQRGNLEKVPLSRRLQLAAKRKVTREEDTAYSLMGILGVDISIAYGEGPKKAFSRLVRELMNVKKSFIDLFNRGYFDPTSTDDILPSSITQYLHRSSEFDFVGHKGHIFSRLENFIPIEPIIITHVGLKIPLLLVPALLMQKDLYGGDYWAYGDFFGTATIPVSHDKNWTSGRIYHLLHNKIFNAQASINATGWGSGPPKIIIFGVINFETDSRNSIILPKQKCLSIPLECWSPEIGNISTSDIAILKVQTYGPTVFQLEPRKFYHRRTREMYVTNLDGRIPMDELNGHGLQLLLASL